MDERFQRKGIRIELLVARRRKKSEAPVLLKLGSLPVGQRCVRLSGIWERTREAVRLAYSKPPG